MIRVTVELVPFGRDEWAKRIGTLLIANDGTLRGEDMGNYVFIRDDDQVGRREGSVSEHDRSGSVWDLIGKCLA
jgi:hypothetical protein